MPISNGIINQKGTPAFYSDIFANRPTYGYAGRVFISTDTGAIYEDTGTSWTLIADAGAGTTGTLQQVTTNGNSTTLGISVQGISITDGAGTGGGNTGVGSSTLLVNTTGGGNTGIGYQSLSANTTGAQNTAIGVSALLSNTTGSSNTAIGYNSLNKNTTSGQNTAIGYLTLGENTSGTLNTAIGYGALALNTTGFSNTAIGSNSLAVNTTGSNNTAIGIDSLNVNTGSNNTAIGRASLTANTTGTLNTAIGYNSGNAITTGSNNTILGNYVGTPTLASNIVLSDGAGNVRLFSDANGLIGINQAVGSTIGGQLDIHSTQTYALVLNGLSTSNAYTAFSNASVGKWRIGNTYNAGANSFDIYNLGTSTTALSFNATTNASTFIGKMNIGTRSASPIRNLNIYAATNDNAIIKLDALDGNGYGAQIDYSSKTSGGTSNTWTLGTGVSQSANSFEFFNGTSATMQLLIGGQVNINGVTASTQIKLGILQTQNNHATYLYVNNGSGNASVYARIDATANAFAYFDYNGAVVGSITTNGTLTAYNVSSDYRLKQDFKNYNGLNLISAIKTYDYEWKLDKSRMYGVIAHELQEILPYAVTGEKDAEQMQGVDYSKIVPILIKSIQELNEKLVRNNIN